MWTWWSTCTNQYGHVTHIAGKWGDVIIQSTMLLLKMKLNIKSAFSWKITWTWENKGRGWVKTKELLVTAVAPKIPMNWEQSHPSKVKYHSMVPNARFYPPWNVDSGGCLYIPFQTYFNKEGRDYIHPSNSSFWGTPSQRGFGALGRRTSNHFPGPGKALRDAAPARCGCYNRSGRGVMVPNSWGLQIPWVIPTNNTPITSKTIGLTEP